MRNFFLAFLVFLAWSILAIWYMTSDATSTLASFFKVDENEINVTIDSLIIKKKQDSIAYRELAVLDSISREKNPEINTARLYAFNEKNEVLFIFDTIYLKKNKDSVFYNLDEKDFINWLVLYLKENKNKTLLILSDYSAGEDFTIPNLGQKRGQFIQNELIQAGADRKYISIKSFIKELTFDKKNEFLGGISFRIETLTKEKLVDLEKNRMISRTIYPTFTFSSIFANKELKDFAIELRSILEDYPDKKVQIIGHTDNIGSSIDNYEMGLKYAQQVRRYLINSENLDKDRLKASSMGQENPIDINTTAEGRNKNRRIEFIIE